MTKGVAMANKKLVDLLMQDENANVASDEFETLSGSDWVRLLSKKPQFADKCNWNKLTGTYWAKLLKKQPQFVVKCDWNKIYRDSLAFFNVLNNRALIDKIDITKLPAKLAAYFLSEYPELIEKYDKWNEMTGTDWCILLIRQPEFAYKCNKWADIAGYVWSILLREQPQFADKCDWSKLGGSDWSNLLQKQPKFADKCDKWKAMTGSDWSRLLQEQPQFADKCDKWKEFENCHWANLLREQPQFADKCDKWDDMDKDEVFSGLKIWRYTLTLQPQLAKYFNKNNN